MAGKNGKTNNGRHVGQQRTSNGKLLGGCTGAGFMPGQSGNPDGRAKGSISLTTILREKLAEGDGQAAKEIIDAAIAKAKDGDPRLLQIILERMEGKVPDRVQLESPGVKILPQDIIEAV